MESLTYSSRAYRVKVHAQWTAALDLCISCRWKANPERVITVIYSIYILKLPPYQAENKYKRIVLRVEMRTVPCQYRKLSNGHKPCLWAGWWPSFLYFIRSYKLNCIHSRVRRENARYARLPVHLCYRVMCYASSQMTWMRPPQIFEVKTANFAERWQVHTPGDCYLTVCSGYQTTQQPWAIPSSGTDSRKAKGQ